MTIQLKRNDTKDTISYTMTYADGTPVNLTGATVRFFMGNGKSLISDSAAVVKSANAGQVEYTLTDADTLIAGTFKAEFQVTFSDGKVKTFPTNGYIMVNIQPNMDVNQSTYIEDQIANRVSDLQVWKGEIQSQLDQFAKGDSAPEVAQARVEKDGTTNNTLKARLDKKEAEFSSGIQNVSAQLAQREQELLDLENKKADTSYVTDVISKISEGTPLFAGSVSGMTDPTRLYVNTTDGYLYMHNGTEFVSTGKLYQSSGIADKSITNTKIADTALGINRNSGITYPLKNIVRDGKLHAEFNEAKNVVLDAKVINAKRGKYYAISYVSNGFNSSYGLTILEFDKKTFGSNSDNGKRQLVYYADMPFTVPTESITTRIIDTADGITFVITVDYSKITTAGGQGVTISSATATASNARGLIIDESCYIYEKLASTESENAKLVAKKDSESLKVKLPYNHNNDIILEWNLLGVNNITHLKTVTLQRKNSNHLTEDFSTNLSTIYTASSDWIGPVAFKSTNGNDNTQFWTGANHGTENGLGYPTASNAGATIYADGTPLNDGDTLFAYERVTIVTKQLISAYNRIDLATGERTDSLLETVTYSITPDGVVEVNVDLEALEEITIASYHGLQMQKGAWGNSIYFVNDPLTFVQDISGTNTANASIKSLAQPDRWISKGSGGVVIGYIDSRYGLGDLSHVDDDQRVFYSTSTKTYANLIWGKDNPKQLQAGDSIGFCGGYVFTDGLECKGAKTAYIIRKRGKKLYVVDFTSAADTVLKVEAEDVNKEIVIITKSDTITCDNFISAKGLKIKASGYGQLVFKVD